MAAGHEQAVGRARLDLRCRWCATNFDADTAADPGGGARSERQVSFPCTRGGRSAVKRRQWRGFPAEGKS